MPDTKQIITRYYKLKNPVTNGHETTHLKVELYYSLGGYNYFTSKSETRGYVISVSPVERHSGLESYIGFTGKKYCLVPVQRQSKKAKEEAKVKFDAAARDFIKMFFSKYDVDLNDYEEKNYD